MLNIHHIHIYNVYDIYIIYARFQKHIHKDAKSSGDYPMNIDNASTISVTLGGGFFVGVLIGYALKKVARLAAVIAGLFFAGLVYLQYQQIIEIKWAKFHALSQNAITTLTNAITQIPGFNSSSDHTASLAFINLGIPLTGSMSMGIAIGFMKG